MWILAQAAGDAALTGGIVGVVLVGLRVLERFLDSRRNGKNSIENENLPHFRQTDRAVLTKMADVCTAKDPTGRPLCYTSPEVVEQLRRHTVLLEAIEKYLARQMDVVDRRVAVCEKHTEILGNIARTVEAR